MDEQEKQQAEQEDKPSYVPASFEKRVAAWVGVVYMVMIVFAMTYAIATGGPLINVQYLLLPPGAVGVFIVAIYRYRRGKIKEGRNFTAALLFLCVIAFLMGLICGVPNLLANFGLIEL